ncbi:hypothetical protein [Niastella sp. OAS944]|uniref:hypothetical protein n=1 Tax=Niastella sp. OAS944 TaxID=2664089 RepID=UPI00348B0BA5|nr:hypothetical protein [Chitinophagaceae bacterium OAS944]
MKKTIITFKKDRDLVTTIKRVLEKLKNNAVFPNPPLALAELEKLLPELEAALVRAKTRDMEWVAVKNGKKAIALQLLEQLAQYVTSVSNDDRGMILSSGFYVTDEQTARPVPAIETLEVELGSAGEATTRAGNITGAIAFVHQYTTEAPGPDTVWVSEESSVRNYTFRGLASDKRHWFRVVAIGRRGKKAYSPVVSRSIQ